MNDILTPEQARLHAYVDGQLDSAGKHDVEELLANSPEAREQVNDYRQINEMLRQLYDPMLEEPVPPLLHVGLQPKAQFSRYGRYLVQSAAAMALLAIGIVGGFYLGATQTELVASADHEAENVVAEAVMAYTVYTPEVRHPVEVPGDQREHLVGWLSKRMGRKLVAPNLDSLDMKLLGGRLLASDDGPGALLMYENDQGKRVILYACLTDESSSAFRFAQQDKVSVYYWVENSVTYAIAGEMQRDSLLPVAESVYSQL